MSGWYNTGWFLGRVGLAGRVREREGCVLRIGIFCFVSSRIHFPSLLLFEKIILIWKFMMSALGWSLTHVCARTHARIHTHARTHAHMHAHMYARTHVRTHTRTHAHTVDK